MTAEEAVQFLDKMYEDEPTYDPDVEGAMDAIREALILAFKALRDVEWNNTGFCVFCHYGNPGHHFHNCPRQIALASMREER